MDPVHVGEHSPFFAAALAAVSEYRGEILRTAIVSIVATSITAAGGYALVINNLKNQSENNRDRLEHIERTVQANQDNINRNLLELVRQAGTDKLVAQRLGQISHRVEEINNRLARIYDGEFRNGRHAYGGK